MSEIVVRSEKIVMVPLSEIKLNPKNRNKHPKEQIDQLINIIKYQGFRRPVTISNRTGNLSCGEGRYLAAKKLKMEKIPAIYQDYDSEEQEYADGIADNAIDKWADLDLSSINNDFTDMGPDFDIDLLGIKGFEIDVADKYDEETEDEVPEYVEPKTKLGDIYRLGNHRLMCGDSTSIDAVEKLMNGEKPDMVYTDPPYGMKLDADFSSIGNDKVGFGKKYEKIKGDHDDFTDDLINTIFYFNEAREIFIWGADYFAQLLPARNDGSWIVWDKRVTENFDKMIGSGFELCWSRSRHQRILARFNYSKFGNTKDDSKSRVHPTQKPVQLTEWFFENWGQANDKVVDLYGGSGSTLIACEKTNRQCFMMELDPHYCDVIVARWEKYTGQTAELTNG